MTGLFAAILTCEDYTEAGSPVRWSYHVESPLTNVNDESCVRTLLVQNTIVWWGEAMGVSEWTISSHNAAAV